MKLYFAPMEGITSTVYRNTHNEFFGFCDEYFAPFIAPTDNEKLAAKNIRDILPNENKVNLRVQCLANSETSVVRFAEKVAELGYDDLNINLGCPATTVVKKKKGSGALRDLDRLYEFLEHIYKNSKIKISIKTRTGFSSHSEFEKILDVYKNFPVSELIVHPRIREDYYKGKPDMNDFDLAYSMDKFRLCYNGDIFSTDDYNYIEDNYFSIYSVMIGRGAIKNPAIFREIKGGEKLTTKELILFSNEIEKRYFALFNSDVYTLQKMKEIWNYMILNYPGETKLAKSIKKSNKLYELNNVINCLPDLL